MSPPDAAPGSVFAYSQPCTYTVAAAIQRSAGQRLSEYLRPRLFEPLGIGAVGWFCYPPGREQGFSGLFARTEDVAKLGQLYLQPGRWGEEQLIPAAYVAQATSASVATANEENVDWGQGYGYWMSRHGYRGDGAFGQFCLVDSSLVITLHERDNARNFAVGSGEWLVSEPRDAYADVVPVAASTGPTTTPSGSR